MTNSEQGTVFDATSALLKELKSVTQNERISVTTNAVAYILSNVLETPLQLMAVLTDAKKLVVQEWEVQAKEQGNKEK